MPLTMSVLGFPATGTADVTTRDDAELCVRAGRGDDGAFGELARRHTPALLRMAMAMGLSEADASDMVQEALLKALEKRHFLATVTKVRGWLYRVALNLFHSRMRKQQRQNQLLDQRRHDVGPQSVDALEPMDARDADAFSVALQTLSPMQRDVVALRAAGLSFAEVARALGSSENACKVHMHHAVKRMKALLKEEP